MPFKIVNNADSKYLAVTDILIGDMSDIVHEFLIFNRPIILLKNDWVIKEMANIGIKCDISFEDIVRSIKRYQDNSDLYRKERMEWLRKTHYKPDGNSSKRVVESIITKSGIDNPRLVFLHNNNDINYVTIKPIYFKANEMGVQTILQDRFKEKKHSHNNIYIASHNEYLNFIPGYKVHVDHGNKGPGVTEMVNKIKQWEKANYWRNTDLFITEGPISYERTQNVLGPFKEKAIMVGFPRSDEYIELDSPETKLRYRIILIK